MSSTHLSRAKVFPFLVDSHAHLDFNDFDGDREKVLERAESRGLKLIINIGCDLQSSQKSIRLAEKYPIIYTAVGIHPHEAAKVPPDYLKLLREMSVHPKVVAIGEIGLDYFRNRSPRDRQIEVFRRQLQLAREVNLPVVLHDREAHEEMLSILETDGLPPAGGVMHCDRP
jgi:TatD DNase family protein